MVSRKTIVPLYVVNSNQTVFIICVHFICMNVLPACMHVHCVLVHVEIQDRH